MAALSAVVTGALVAAGCGATTNEEGLGTGKDTPAATTTKPTTEIKGYGDAIIHQEQVRNQQAAENKKAAKGAGAARK
jgi:hypothetical protein